MSLRRMLMLMIAGLSALAVIAAASLVVVSTILHWTTQSVGQSIHSVRIAEDIRTDLLLHERVDDKVARAALEAGTRSKLDSLEQYISTENEAQQLAQVKKQLNDYFSLNLDEPSEHQLDTTFGAVQSFVRLNIQQADMLQRAANRWDNVANILALGVAVVLLLSVVPAIIWMRRYSYGAIRNLQSAMKALGNGALSTRLEETGPAEIRDIAQRFNGMAETLAAQRQRQFAFVGGVAHDLRTPLAVIKMSTTTLESGTGLSEDRRQKTVARLHRQVDRLEHMVEDLLDATRIEAGRLKLDFTPADLRETVREVTDQVQAGAEHQLSVDVPEEPVWFPFDQSRLEQVLSNLVSNAIKYSPAGSDVIVRLQQSGADVILEVTDQGIGMTEQERQQLFQAFTRVGASRNVAPGVGLGLFVAHGIVEAHGGRMEVESEPDRGSTFRVVLPVAQARMEATSVSLH